MNYSRFLPALCLAALFFGACSNVNKTAQTTTTSAKNQPKVYVVSSESAAFFRRGPQSGRDPDKTLPRDTVLKLIRPSFGFSKVEIAETGEQGYISSEEIRPASSNLIAAASAPKVDPLVAPSSTPAVEQFNLDSNDPRLVPPPENLPDSEAPPPLPEQ